MDLELEGVRLQYDEAGPTGAPPILFVHGLSSARTTWDRISPQLAGAHHVVRVDLRGHGESGHAPGTYVIDRYGEDVVELCDRVVGAPAIVVGHSLGGVVAAWVAQRRPDLVRGLLLEDPPLYRGVTADGEPDSSGVAAFFPVMRQLLIDMQGRGAAIDEYVAMLRATPALNQTGTMLDVLGEDGVLAMALAWQRLDPEVFTPAIAGTALAGFDPDRRLSCALRLLRADPALGPAFTSDDAAAFSRSNPDADVRLVEGASHAIHDEQPKRFEQELGEFIEHVATGHLSR